MNRGYTLRLSAKGVGINLFKGVWRDEGEKKAHGFIYDEGYTKVQTTAANLGGHIAHLVKDGASIFLDRKYFDSSNRAKLIFEGVEASNPDCKDNAEECYLLAEVYGFDRNGKEKKLLEQKVYLDLHDINDFYETWTAGTAQLSGADITSHGCPAELSSVLYLTGLSDWGNPGFPPQMPNDLVRLNSSSPTQWIYENVALTEQHDANKVIFVHGWRMLDSEKKAFADTTFKRLYWMGYQGQFAVVTWPTAWFDKPAHCYGGLVSATLARGHAQNYDLSEVAARLTGVKLKMWLEDQRSENSGTALHLIAHSMGNVVVSEALRHASGFLVDSYSATQAAEVSGSYDSSISSMLHRNVLTNAVDEPVVSWRRYQYGMFPNLDSEYAMPPDIYRLGNLVEENAGVYSIKHKKTERDADFIDQFVSAEPYYFNSDGNRGSLDGKANRIVNFYNPRDVALSAWEFNQLTKPDVTGGDVWGYSNEQICQATEYDMLGDPVAWAYPDGSSCVGPNVEVVSSRFYRDNVQMEWNPNLPVDGSVVQNNYLYAVAHIIPSRTNAMGQLEMPAANISTNVNNNAFTDSNQGHSAEFHGYLSELGRNRSNYWLSVLQYGFGLDPENAGELSGLCPIK